MTAEEIARKLSEHNYLRLCKKCEEEAIKAFSAEQYWEMNKEYFKNRAKIYLEVKDCLDKA